MKPQHEQFIRAFFREVSFINLSPRPPEFGTCDDGQTWARFGLKDASECVEMFFPPDWMPPRPERDVAHYTLENIEHILRLILTSANIRYMERDWGNEAVGIANVRLTSPKARQLTVTCTLDPAWVGDVTYMLVFPTTEDYETENAPWIQETRGSLKYGFQHAKSLGPLIA